MILDSTFGIGNSDTSASAEQDGRSIQGDSMDVVTYCL